jgi:hypothetical protein
MKMSNEVIPTPEPEEEPVAEPTAALEEVETDEDESVSKDSKDSGVDEDGDEPEE